MTSDTQSKTKICPTCGSKIAIESQRCVVCGADVDPSAYLTGASKASRSKGASQRNVVQGPRVPEITLSLPVAILLFALFLVAGAVMVFIALRQQPEAVIPPTVTSTPTMTATVTITPTPMTPTVTNTPLPTATPITHTVQQNETCLGIALFYGVSVQSIVALNNLSVQCILSVNQQLQIPQPTATVTPLPTATLNEAQKTDAACNKVNYTVQPADTLGGIASAYNVPMEAIAEYNGLTGNTVFEGQNLTIPLCRQFATPGPSPTPTLPPPYAAPALLLPADGAPFTGSNTITLQWASVGSLAANELYVVTIEDVTAGDDTREVAYVTDTKYIIPSALRPKDNIVHIFRWRVSVVRQTGTAPNGDPQYSSAGAVSLSRVFSWLVSGGSAPDNTPTP